MSLELSVIVAAHNPDAGRLSRVVAALRAQTLPAARWETILVDNASDRFPEPAAWSGPAPANLRRVQEPVLGLTSARLKGFAEARGRICVLVDDDNVLDGDYLETVLAAFEADAGLGAIGGRSVPEFAAPPAAWVAEFHGLLALRDLGARTLRATWNGADERSYPQCSPIGAGMALRREAAAAYVRAVEQDSERRQFDRAGAALVSGGDNDLVMTLLEAGFAVEYLPALRLTHLIPAGRCGPAYLGALNRAIARSWVRVLARHGIRPWPPLSAWLRARQARAWWRSRAWRGPAEWVRWQGLCGLFEGRADLANNAGCSRGR